jgi:hypothetical protein
LAENNSSRRGPIARAGKTKIVFIFSGETFPKFISMDRPGYLINLQYIIRVAASGLIIGPERRNK